MRIYLAIIALLFTASNAFAQATYTYSTPALLNDGWQVSHLNNEGIDTALYIRFINELPADKKHSLHSFLLMRNNKLVFEKYFSGQDATTPHDLRSATKSITSLLVGIAIDKGYIKSIDEPISKYLQGYHFSDAKDARNTITIRHLLTMSSGLQCNDMDKSTYGQEDKIYKRSNWLEYIDAIPMMAHPADTTTYCTAGVILLGEIIKQATGIRLDSFADQYLFTPLGISNAQWAYFNHNNNVDAGGHLQLTSRAFSKIGQLVLQQGNWQGHQLVSKQWIDTATAIHTSIDKAGYGFLWWSVPFLHNDKTVTANIAWGNGGQYLFIIRELNIVAAFTGGNYNKPEAMIPFDIIQKLVLPSIR